VIKTTIAKFYRKFVPYFIRVKVRQRYEIERYEAHFKRHINDFMFDVKRKKDMLEVFSLLKKNGVNMFPQIDRSIYKKYITRKLQIKTDTDTGLLYVLVDDVKKLFYKKGMTEKQVKQFFNDISIEQDYTSPHRYFTNDYYFVGVIEPDTKLINHCDDSFGVNTGVVVDVGAAEGNFALSVIEKAGKVYIRPPRI
jgi:hypothetical protein